MNTKKKNNGKKAKSVIDFKVNISANIILEKEEGLYVAHCLEFDIVADGKTKNEAIKNIFHSIVSHIDFCLTMGNIDKIENPAPKEYWNKLEIIKKESSYKPVKIPKSISKEAKNLPFHADIKFEGSEVFAYI